LLRETDQGCWKAHNIQTAPRGWPKPIPWQKKTAVQRGTGKGGRSRHGETRRATEKQRVGRLTVNNPLSQRPKKEKVTPVHGNPQQIVMGRPSPLKRRSKKMENPTKRKKGKKTTHEVKPPHLRHDQVPSDQPKKRLRNVEGKPKQFTTSDYKKPSRHALGGKYGKDATLTAKTLPAKVGNDLINEMKGAKKNPRNYRLPKCVWAREPEPGGGAVRKPKGKRVRY